MTQQVEQTATLRFKRVQLFKDQVLGIGSYGKVCKAKCDDLLCAAKLIHETLFDPTAQQLVAPQREHRLPMRRFVQECEFLSTIRHPNIVQYLGLYRDLDTGLPALLMELMDDSLTHYLESSTQLIPYHIQVNICHDITLALSFLHSNNIVHRDLSSNNVLLIGNAVRAKVTDFGMARLGDENPRVTHLTFTMCPGTDVYMPPEAVQDEPVYTEKIDCFSFGVITLQILTRQFPKPGNRRKRIEIGHPGLPSGTMADVLIGETERRQNHISQIDPNHTLLQVSLDCLKDRDVERPSAQQLCEKISALKEAPEYTESVRTAVEERSAPEQGAGDKREREIRSLRQQHTLQIYELEQALRKKDELIAAGQQRLRDEIGQLEKEKYEENQRHISELQEKGQLIEQKDRQLRRVNQQLEECEQAIAQFQRRIVELEQPRPSTDGVFRSQEQVISDRSTIKMTWRDGGKIPCKVSTCYSAVADSAKLYYRKDSLRAVFAYTISTSTWSQLPKSPNNCCPLVIVNNLLTLVGGLLNGNVTNKLFSLTGEGSGRRWPWTEKFPPMPTKRLWSIALCTGKALIVAGGDTESALQTAAECKTVEVMNTETLQWYTAADLPRPVSYAPGAVCGDHAYVYILSLPKSDSKCMYTCPVSALIQSCESIATANVWKTVTAPPVIRTTCVSILGRLLTIGGRDSNDKPTTAVHMYNPTTDSWEVISHMLKSRSLCFAAVLPNNELMVGGGFTANYNLSNWFVAKSPTDTVELATVC